MQNYSHMTEDKRVPGKHLVLDMYGVPESVFRDHHGMYTFLDKFPDKIGMTKVSAPHIVFFENDAQTPPGISGYIILAESHISFHTWPDKSYVSLDVYSCKDFDTEDCVEKVKAFWKPGEEVRVQEIIRG